MDIFIAKVTLTKEEVKQEVRLTFNHDELGYTHLNAWLLARALDKLGLIDAHDLKVYGTLENKVLNRLEMFDGSPFLCLMYDIPDYDVDISFSTKRN